jgi:hypothetical protein
MSNRIKHNVLTHAQLTTLLTEELTKHGVYLEEFKASRLDDYTNADLRDLHLLWHSVVTTETLSKENE